MSIARKTAIVMGSRISILGITLVSGIVLNRLAGSEGRGVYVLATGLAFTQLQNLVSLGIQVSNQVFVAKEPGLLGRLHAWVLALTAAVEVVTAVVVWVFWGALTQGIFRGIAPLHLILVTAAVGPAFYWMAWQGLMVGLGDIKGMSAFNLLLALVQNVLLVAVLALWRLVAPGVALEAVIDLLVIVFVVSLALSTLAMAWMLRRHGPLTGPLEWRTLRALISFGARVYAGNYASGLLNQLDQILVNAFTGVSSLGTYNQASSLASKVWMVSAAIESSAYSPVSSADRGEARRLTAELFRVTLWMSMGLIVAGWALSPLIPVIYGKDFEPTVRPFQILILGTAVFGCARMFSMYFTGNRKSPQTLLVLNWILVPIHANLCLWLIPGHGVKGAALATTLTFALSMAILLILFLRDGSRVPLGRLFLPQREDWARAKAIAGRVLGRRTESDA